MLSGKASSYSYRTFFSSCHIVVIVGLINSRHRNILITSRGKARDTTGNTGMHMYMQSDILDKMNRKDGPMHVNSAIVMFGTVRF